MKTQLWVLAAVVAYAGGGGGKTRPVIPCEVDFAKSSEDLPLSKIKSTFPWKKAGRPSFLNAPDYWALSLPFFESAMLFISTLLRITLPLVSIPA